MSSFTANTDLDWHARLLAQAPTGRPHEEVNFWRPSTRLKLPFNHVNTFAALDRPCPKLLKADAVAFDVETAFQRELCLAQVGTPNGSWLIDALAIDELSPLARVLESPRVVKIIHYTSFERSVMSRRGIDIVNVFDTHVASKKQHATKVHGSQNTCHDLRTRA